MIIGSQNYVVYSVLAGTGEIAIVTTDSDATNEAIQKLSHEYDYATNAVEYGSFDTPSQTLNA